MGAFRWISEGLLPDHCDLRRRGWRLAEADEGVSDCILIAHAAVDDLPGVVSPHETLLAARRRVLVTGVNTSDRRASLLKDGFGDAVGDGTPLIELEARARRLAELSRWLPRRRSFATLELDLLAREAAYLGRPMGLHPLEFGILWRLSETPDDVVERHVLVKDVWRLNLLRSNNSMAVQLSRLRAKLVSFGLAGLVETVPGGYLFRSAVIEPGGSSLWAETRRLPAFDIGAAPPALS